MSPVCDTVPLFFATPTQNQGMWCRVLPAHDTAIHNDPPSLLDNTAFQIIQCRTNQLSLYEVTTRDRSCQAFDSSDRLKLIYKELLQKHLRTRQLHYSTIKEAYRPFTQAGSGQLKISRYTSHTSFRIFKLVTDFVETGTLPPVWEEWRITVWQRSQETVAHRKCTVEAGRRNGGKKVSSKTPPRLNLWKNRR